MAMILVMITFTVVSLLQVGVANAGSLSNSLELNRAERLHTGTVSSNDLDYVWLDTGSSQGREESFGYDEESNGRERRRNSQRNKSRFRHNNNHVPDLSNNSRRNRYRAGSVSDTLIIQAEPEFNTGKKDFQNAFCISILFLT